MTNFAEVLISTTSGFLIAFLSEPVKSLIQNYVEKKRLRRALYKEIALNYDHLSTIIEMIENGKIQHEYLKKNLELQIAFDRYDFAKSHQSNLFYELIDNNEIVINRRNFSLLLELNDTNQLMQYCKSVLMSFQKFVKENSLDKNLLLKVSTKSATERIKTIT